MRRSTRQWCVRTRGGREGRNRQEPVESRARTARACIERRSGGVIDVLTRVHNELESGSARLDVRIPTPERVRAAYTSRRRRRRAKVAATTLLAVAVVASVTW